MPKEAYLEEDEEDHVTECAEHKQQLRDELEVQAQVIAEVYVVERAQHDTKRHLHHTVGDLRQQ